MDFMSIDFVGGLAAGGVIGFVGALAVGRDKFRNLQNASRDRIDELRERLMELSAELGTERQLNEGLQASLFDAAAPSTKRITRSK